MALETWELTLIIGSGTTAFLMCAYSVYILMRRRRPATPLTRVVVEMEERRGTKESNPLANKDVKTGVKIGSKTTATKDVKSAAKKDAKTGVKIGSKTAATKDVKSAAKKDAKTAVKNEPDSSAKTDAKNTIAKPVDNGEASTEVIAVKIQPNRSAVTCPGADKACMGARKDYVETRPRRDESKRHPKPRSDRRHSAPTV
jgi:hypothetical protein